MTRIALIAAAVLLLGASPARGEVVAKTGYVRSQHVSAYGGKVVFSAKRSRARYVLMVHERGRTTRVPIHSRRGTGFDVDLGPGPDGGTVAVFSRCELRDRRRDCDIHQYDFRRGVEEVAAGVNTRRGSESHPAIWRGRIAFARELRHVFEPRIYLARSGEIRRVPGGAHNHREEDAYPPRVVSLDLVGTRVAFVWNYRPWTCGDIEEDPWIDAYQVIVGGRPVQEGCTGASATGFPSVALDRRHAYFTYASHQADEVRLRRIRLRTGTVADSREQLFGPIAVAGDRVFVATHGRIERLRPTFVAVTAPTFDE